MLSARTNPRTVAIIGQLITGLITATVALSSGSAMTSTAWWWSAAGAAGCAVGVVSLYRGLSRGRMSVVAPLSGIGAAIVPACVGFLQGERPSGIATIGLLGAVPAILLVAHIRDTSQRPSGWPEGLIAGAGFGLNFLAVARLPEGSGLAGLAVMQLGAATLIALTLTGSVGRSTPTLRGVYVLGAAVTGILAGLAMLLFQIASRHGYLSETAVLSSLYPAATVVLALVLLGERVSRVQLVGFALCAVSIALIVSG